VYAGGTILAGGVVNRVHTTPESRWLPDFGAIPDGVARSSKVMWLNYPCNPTGACATVELFGEAVSFANRHHLIVASDLAYSEVYFGTPVPSLWQAKNADVNSTLGIEFHSLSKTFNMTGWRVGFAVGHEEVIGALRQVKDNYDSGVFNAIQAAGAVALERYEDPVVTSMREEYRKRRNLAVAGLRAIGCEVTPPEAGIFVFARCPADRRTGRPMDSWKFAIKLIEEAAVVTVPGAGFDETASGYFRLSLTRETHRIGEAMERLKRLAW
jgi:LL-diaminopimelate aminotransferase